jgi:hypothetical protein
LKRPHHDGRANDIAGKRVVGQNHLPVEAMQKSLGPVDMFVTGNWASLRPHKNLIVLAGCRDDDHVDFRWRQRPRTSWRNSSQSPKGNLATSFEILGWVWARSARAQSS